MRRARRCFLSSFFDETRCLLASVDGSDTWHTRPVSLEYLTVALIPSLVHLSAAFARAAAFELVTSARD